MDPLFRQQFRPQGLSSFDRVEFRDSWGPVVQGGLDFDLGHGWSLGLDVKYTWADTRLTWRDGEGNTITTRHEIDPLIVTANIGYRFNLDALFGGPRLFVPGETSGWRGAQLRAYP